MGIMTDLRTSRAVLADVSKAQSAHDSNQVAVVQMNVPRQLSTVTVTRTQPSFAQPTATPTSAGILTAPGAAISTLPPSPTAAAEVEIKTPIQEADYLFGYIKGRTACTLATQVVVSLMNEWGWRVSTVPVDDATALFQGVAHLGEPSSWFDLSLCYHDPEDRALFYRYGGRMLIVGDGYAQHGDTQLSILAYVSIPPLLRHRDNCIWTFIKQLDFEDASLDGMNPRDWIDAHPELVASWESCADLAPTIP